MGILYTKLSPEEALARLKDATTQLSFGKWLRGAAQDTNHEVWSRIRGTGFEIGFVGRGIGPPTLTLGSIVADPRSASTRVRFRVFGAIAWASVWLVVSPVFVLMPWCARGPSAPKGIAEALAMVAASAAVGFLVTLGLAHALLRNDTRRLVEFLRDTLEASEQPAAEHGKA